MHHFSSENVTESDEDSRGDPCGRPGNSWSPSAPESDEYYGIDPLWSPSDTIYPARDAERSQHSFDQVGTRFIASPDAPIGLFDSGAGGLTILSALRQELPCENYIYFGDTAHCPYGLRSDAGVAATNQAAKALYLRQLIDEFAEGIEVYAVGCPELVTLVEQGELDGSGVEEVVRHALQPLLAKNVDVIVLGCTHFPALRPVIERITDHRVHVIDSGSAVARRTRSVLNAEALIRQANSASANSELRLWCSGNPAAFSAVSSKLLGYPVVATQTTL